MVWAIMNGCGWVYGLVWGCWIGSGLGGSGMSGVGKV